MGVDLPRFLTDEPKIALRIMRVLQLLRCIAGDLAAQLSLVGRTGDRLASLEECNLTRKLAWNVLEVFPSIRPLLAKDIHVVKMARRKYSLGVISDRG